MLKRPRKDRYVKSGDSKSLAIFWWTGDSFICAEDSVDGPSVTRVGNRLRIEESPSEVWRRSAPPEILASVNWDDYPRGNIQYDEKLDKFIVYGDKKLTDDIYKRKMIMFRFGLPDETKFIADPSCKSKVDV